MRRVPPQSLCGNTTELLADTPERVNVMDPRLAWVWLAQACGAGSRAALNLLYHFETPEKIWKADRRTLASVLHSSEISLLTRLAYKDTADAAEIIRRCDASDIRILTPMDARYPRSLYQLRDAPCVLYVRGELPDFEQNCCCAVVGTRKMSDYGKQMAYDIGRGLGAGGSVLVSGLALGVDGMAMAGALSAGGITIGVLGCGVDITYPQEHRTLINLVMEKGAVISEYAPGTPPVGSHFPVRNRIISGLCSAVAVVEGDLKSGALITARHALYQGRDLYAVPGQVGDPGAAGPNLLIKTGAHAISCASDILKNYEFMYPHTIRVSAADAALETLTSAEDAADAAARMHISAAGDSKYYGSGNYGGKRTSSSGTVSAKPKKEKSEKKITPKAMLKRFDEHKEEPERKMIPANPINFDMLDDNAKTVYAAMTPNVPTLLDDIHAASLTTAEILTALTLLELCGAVECTAGSCYLKREGDDPILSDPDKQ